MQIRRMTQDDLAMVLGWAQEEGWNPGLDDAVAFFAADPHGFFLGEVAGVPVAAISVVAHDPTWAFLGLYIVRPEWRGQGHGLALWSEALKHAGARAVGLDGVPDQQANYARSGFVWQDKTVRFEGQPRASAGTRPATSRDLAALRKMDQQMVGYARDAFAQVWFAGTGTRSTQVLERDGAIRGYVTFRRCHAGLKAGPLWAGTAEDALALLGAAPRDWGPGPVCFDAGDGTAMADLLQDQGFQPVFDTARMVRGAVPPAQPPAYACVATLELG